MSWQETDTLKLRILFINDYQSNLYNFTELCEKYNISRKTGYKWLKRYREEGSEGLKDRPHTPHTVPHRTPLHIEQLIVQKALQKKTWGPKKILKRLQHDHPEIEKWPAKSTAGDILERHGFTKKQRKKRKKSERPADPYVQPTAPHDVWSVDFKGEFKLQDGTYCYPLTVQDVYSRYILAVVALPSTRMEFVKPVFERLFKA